MSKVESLALLLLWEHLPWVFGYVDASSRSDLRGVKFCIRPLQEGR
jgi:hypothetical protein